MKREVFFPFLSHFKHAHTLSLESASRNLHTDAVPILKLAKFQRSDLLKWRLQNPFEYALQRICKHEPITFGNNVKQLFCVASLSFSAFSCRSCAVGETWEFSSTLQPESFCRRRRPRRAFFDHRRSWLSDYGKCYLVSASIIWKWLACSHLGRFWRCGRPGGFSEPCWNSYSTQLPRLPSHGTI